MALEDGTYEFAKNVENRNLFNSKEVIAKIVTNIKRGFYSPYTEAGNYFVIKSNGEKVLAHCIGNFKNPKNYDFLIRFLGRLFPSGDYTHPII